MFISGAVFWHVDLIQFHTNKTIKKSILYEKCEKKQFAQLEITESKNKQKTKKKQKENKKKVFKPKLLYNRMLHFVGINIVTDKQ